MNCPNCGTPNEPEARFCYNCGTALSGGASTAAPRQDDPAPAGGQSGGYWGEGPAPERPSAPDRGTGSAPGGSGQGWSTPGSTAEPWGRGGQAVTPAEGQRGIPPQWDMAPDPYGQPPASRRRRSRWLVIPLGILAVCLVLCIGLFAFGLTPTGEDFFGDLGTQVSERATAEAVTTE